MSFPLAEQEALKARKLGRARNGTVFLRNFDEGIILTLGAVLDEALQRYYIPAGPGNPLAEPPLDNVCPPEATDGSGGSLPGIPITFGFPEDIYANLVYPAVIVRRDDFSQAMERWHPGSVKYRTAARGALKVATVDGVDRFDKIEEAFQSEPTDIIYTISILSKLRQGVGQRSDVNAILQHVMCRFQAYSSIYVKDSIGDWRTYEAFKEGVSHLDDLPEVGGRVIGFALTIRVEGELDLVSSKETKTVTRSPIINLGFGT